ncbi:hypothetical protein [Bacillus wiedmannii]|uniref:hypothetical protein n=1 Tax=Bacillus wiedmannii TaxID=1890302 RepID=UPI002E2027A2|nr:hypothetical protein [Bacillus wiedmannii]
MEKTMMEDTTSMMMSMEKMMCEMKCMKMMMNNMMNNMMQMNVNMDKAMVSKMHECDEMMTSTMSMMKATKEKCC